MKNILLALGVMLFSTPVYAQAISQLGELTAPEAADETVIVDKSDTTQSANGSTKKIQMEHLYVGSVNYTVCPAGSNVACNYTTDGTDDDVQIQAAIDALPATGGIVTLLDGTYTIGEAIELPSNMTFHITSAATLVGEAGYAPANCSTINSKSVCSLIKNDNDTTGNDYINIIVDGDVNLEGITVDYDNCWSGIALNKTDYSNISGSGYVHHIAYGVPSEGNGGTSRYHAVLITEGDHNTVQDIRVGYTGDDVVRLSRESNDNLIIGVHSSHAKYGHAFQEVTSTIYGFVTGDTIGKRNKFIGNYGYDVDQTGETGTQDAFFESCIAIHSGDSTQVIGNTCNHSGGGIIVHDQSVNVNIADNYIYDWEKGGIVLWGLDGYTLSGHTVDNNVLVGGPQTPNTGSSGGALNDYWGIAVYTYSATAGSTVENIKITNNRVSGVERCIEVIARNEDINEIHISGNTLSDCGIAGIGMDTGTSQNLWDVTIADNFILEAQIGILASNSLGGSQDSIFDINVVNNTIISATASYDGVVFDGTGFLIQENYIDVTDRGFSESTGSSGNKLVDNEIRNSTTAYTIVGADTIITRTEENNNFAQYTLDGSAGGCLMIRDNDDAGWTQAEVLNGAWVIAADDGDGLCD